MRDQLVSIEDSLLVFVEPDGVPGRWRLLSGGAIIGRGDRIEELPEARPWVQTILAVPGEAVTIRWLELDESLTSAQAAAAARLQLADESLEPIGDMHVAAGRREDGKVAVALVPAERMQGWIGAAREASLEPDLILPTTLLLSPPAEGFVRYAEDGQAPDYRARASAFAIEDDLAGLVIGDAAVTTTGARGREAALGPVLADPALNLRQGAFTKRRPMAAEKGWLKRAIWLGVALLVASLGIEVVGILRASWALDAVQAETAELRRAAGGQAAGPAQGGGFARLAGILSGAVRDTPNTLVAQMTYQPEGTLRASVTADAPPTLEALRARVEANGAQATLGIPTTANGRSAAELTMRPR